MPSPLHLIALTILFAATSLSSASCPPFTSPLPFPFSASPDLGHPHFQIQCSTPHSIITINNVSFSILGYKPNDTSLHLSPLSESTHYSSSLCTSSFFSSSPSHSINLSTTPFHFSDHSCSLLTALKSYPSYCSAVPKCNLCSWECALPVKQTDLLHGCESTHTIDQHVCRFDVLEYLQTSLHWRLELEWDEEQDPYFLKCKHCRGICGYNSSDPNKHFLCFVSQSQSQSLTPPWIRRDNPNRIVMLCTLLVCACILGMVGVITLVFRYKGMKSTTNEEDPTMLFLHRQRSASLLPPVFNYEELDSATNHFDPRRKIGDGGFGSVYLGQLFDNRIVAVKKLHKPPQSMTRTTSEKAFCNEILILSSIEHPNLVKLHGYCSDARGLLLVYDYVPNGTLADHLHGSKGLYRKGVLSWQTRVEIALQTAMAIEYLHFGVKPAIVHRDITSSNIFVEKDMRIKLGDFGLSRLLICTESSSSSSGSGFICTGPQGTPGYLDPDYHRSFRLTEKSDVYSFGVVLFELISGMRAVDLARDKREVALADLVVSKIQIGSLHQVVDPVLIVEGEAMGAVDSAAELAFRCVAVDIDDRPDAKEVVAELKRIKNRTRGHKGFGIPGDVCKF